MFKDREKRLKYYREVRRLARCFIPCQEDRHDRCIVNYRLTGNLYSCNCHCHHKRKVKT